MCYCWKKIKKKKEERKLKNIENKKNHTDYQEVKAINVLLLKENLKKKNKFF